MLASRFFSLGSLVLGVAILCCTSMALGQDDEKDDKKGDNPPKIPSPEESNLNTGDGVQLAITYYPSNKGKDAIPVILLHEWEGNRGNFSQLAPYLQSLGFAVVVPYLRGHGDSKKWLGGRDLDTAKMTGRDFAMIIPGDLEAIREFLRAKNNEGELNINKLCVVGAEMGASLAMQFALYDWTRGPSGDGQYGIVQMGRFVKALVLISPKWSFRGLTPNAFMKNPYVCSRISVMIIVGKEKSAEMSDARRLFNMFKRFHPEPTPEDKADKKDLYLGALGTSLQGTKMLEGKGLKVDTYIAKFIDLRLSKSKKSKSFGWKERKPPHE
jgi:pimeloyl-ACP methyl ester carboxylesterase